MNKKILGNVLLLITAIIWGSAFVAQITGMDVLGPFTFSATRSLIATIFLGFLVMFLKDEMNTKTSDLIKGGLACGVFIFIASSLQQFGLLFTTAGKASFITTLYILIVPILALLIMKNKISLATWIAIILGAIGLYLLAIPSGASFSINKGDFVVFIGAFFWAAHILVIDYFTKKVNPVKLSFMQFAVMTILSAIVAMLFERETATLSNIMLSWKSIAYAGFFSSGIAYTLQMVGQKYTNPVLASLILSLESVFGALSGYLFLNEILSTKEFLGCVIVFVAIIIAQVPNDFFKRK
ncbi:MAG: DMT family transporter [Fusobacterium gastrosuis]|uniref:DMT family transporter n=1 Tax=Fusobacterium gastrosuis TaxID=1755100 RepID=UPI0025FCE636|nr:DMT family transporter [uncultured Fusobacterium sp.]MDD7410438.1 DMT family transporter [Fusobacteriaceae bacterium]MDY4011646.1 DMT family transporter [Fusobacterium gastrosuis]MDY5712771.1 DMT family transporter [Fusobacterium gastrosuis]